MLLVIKSNKLSLYLAIKELITAQDQHFTAIISFISVVYLPCARKKALTAVS